MTNHKATNGDPLSYWAESIYDARAFHINDADKWHVLDSFPTGVSVRGKCGVMASTLDYDYITRRATWANGYDGQPCKTCEESA